MKNKLLFVCGVIACLAIAAIDTRILTQALARDKPAEIKVVSVADRLGNSVFMTSAQNGMLGFQRAKSRDKSSFPRLAVSADGIQIIDSAGRIRHIDLDELAALDK